MMIKNYEDAVSYCMEIPRFTKKNTLSDTENFYERLGNPGKRLKIIHVAGTNGKGSVCSFLYSMLQSMEKKCGLFTSPHLTDIKERIQLNGRKATEDEFFQGFSFVWETLKEFQKETGHEEYHPSFFEMLFFVAMVVFENSDLEYLVMETGLGGRLDTTNIVKKPIACVITKIGYDHMEYLGDTLSAIAAEKAGIIKEEIPVVFWDEKKEITEVITKKAKEKNASCVSVSKAHGNLIRIRDKQVDFSYKSRYYEYIEGTIASTASYQVENALIALRTMETIFNSDALSKELLMQGIYHMTWQGRMEEVLPGVYLDGAHNEDGICALIDTVKLDNCTGKRYLLFAVAEDKQFEKMSKNLCESGLFHELIATQMDNKRSLDTDGLIQAFANYANVSVMDSVETGFEALMGKKEPEDLIYVTGSLYLIGQLKQYIEVYKND